MNEEQQENIQQTAAETTTTTTSEAAQTEPQTAQEQLPRTFTQDELNAIVKERLDRQTSKFLERLGLDSMDGIDGLLEHAKGYTDAQELMTKFQLENEELRQQIAFRDNDVNMDKVDDIRAYFKGKGLEFTPDALKEQLITHPEWVRQQPKTTTIRTLSPEKNAPKSVDEWEYAKKLFGLK